MRNYIEEAKIASLISANALERENIADYLTGVRYRTWIEARGLEYSLLDLDIDFDTWMEETVVTAPYQEATELVREFVAPVVTEEDLDAYLSTNKTYGKMHGELYGDYRVPFTNEDAMGMLQVKAGFEMGLTATNIEFSNGTVMPMVVTDFSAFALWFVERRNGYFL